MSGDGTNWADSTKLRRYFDHGCLDGRTFNQRTDYESCSWTDFTRIDLKPPGEPKIRTRSILIWFQHHGYGNPSKSLAEGILEIAYGMEMKLLASRTVAQSEVRRILTQMYLEDGTNLDLDQRTFAESMSSLTWKEVRCAKFGIEEHWTLRQVLSKSGLWNGNSDPTKEEFEMVVGRLFGERVAVSETPKIPPVLETARSNLKSVLESARIRGRPCGTPQELLALSLNEVVHELEVKIAGTYYVGATLLRSDSNAEWLMLLRRAFGRICITREHWNHRRMETDFIAARPKMLRGALKNGIWRGERVATPRDWLKLGIHQVVWHTEIDLPGQERFRALNLLKYFGGQTVAALIAMLCHAFGVEAVKEAMTDVRLDMRKKSYQLKLKAIPQSGRKEQVRKLKVTNRFLHTANRYLKQLGIP